LDGGRSTARQFLQAAITRFRCIGGAALVMSSHLEPRGRVLALERGPGGAYEAYNEAAFHHFLGVETRRAERHDRAVVLVLVELETGVGFASISSAVAIKLFSALAGCVREIDFTGWYRAGRTAGAVLIQDGCSVSPETSSALGSRVGAALRARLPRSIVTRVQVRVIEMPFSTEI
jgi:hypothetical protein